MGIFSAFKQGYIEGKTQAVHFSSDEIPENLVAHIVYTTYEGIKTKKQYGEHSFYKNGTSERQPYMLTVEKRMTRGEAKGYGEAIIRKITKKLKQRGIDYCNVYLARYDCYESHTYYYVCVSAEW